MQIVAIEDMPSQRYTLQVGDASFDCQFMYNQLADRWSLTVWREGIDCPLVAGRFILPGADLFAGLNLSEMLIALDRPGIITQGLNWYDRMVKPLADGLAPTFVVQGTATELSALFVEPASVIC